MDFSGLQLLGALVKNAATFEEGKPMTIDVPASSDVVDLSKFGLGMVRFDTPVIPVTATKLNDIVK